jgi:hypothetical protein
MPSFSSITSVTVLRELDLDSGDYTDPNMADYYSEALLDAFKISVCFSDNDYVFGFFFDAI